MQDVTGDITLKFIRGVESISNTPVVIISGNLNKDLLKSTYKDGATGFISKPFNKEILYQK
jgi:FixJ family two-component response regulator